MHRSARSPGARYALPSPLVLAAGLLLSPIETTARPLEGVKLAFCAPYEPNPAPPVLPPDWLPQAISPEPGVRFRSIRRVPWRSATYCSTGGTGVVVRHGRHEIPGEMGYVLRVQRVVYGDLDGDGSEEAVVQTLENGEGFSGVTGSVLVYGLRDGELLLVGALAEQSTVDEALRRRLWDRWPARVTIRNAEVWLRLPGVARPERHRVVEGAFVRVG